MSRAGFYTDNELRCYPFKTGVLGVRLPTYVIVDFGCVMKPGSEFIEGLHKVWLYQVSKNGQSYKFEFKTDAPGLAGRSLVFEFFEDDAEFTTRFATDDMALGSSGVWDSTAVTEIKWEGYLVIGILGYANYALVEILPNNAILWENPPVGGLEWKAGSFLMEQIYPLNIGSSLADTSGAEGGTVEPALIQNLSGSYVKKINIANKPRTKATPPIECYSSSSTGPDPNIVNATDIVGDVKTIAGYNCDISVSIADNSITISASVGSGEGEPCFEVSLSSSEVPPPDSQLLSGGPTCKETIKSINGIGGREVRITGGLGVVVTDSQLTPNTIIVTPDHNGMALCGNYTTSSIGG
jgi:hypothetical protein